MPSKIEIPQYAIGELRNSLLGDDVDRHDVLELLIEARNEGLNVRDFAAFLRMADRIYAVFYSAGPRAYARRFRQQLKIDSIHASLLDIKFVEEIGNIAKSHPIITIWIAGNALHKGGEFFKNFTEGLLNLKHLLFEGAPTEPPKPATEIGGSANLPNVPQIRDISDQKLTKTSDDALTQVAGFVDEVLKNENLNQAGRFAREVVVDLKLRIRRKHS
jgi:hypothetical protein